MLVGWVIDHKIQPATHFVSPSSYSGLKGCSPSPQKGRLRLLGSGCPGTLSCPLSSGCPQPCPDPPRTEILPTAAPALGCFVVACCLPQKAGMGRSSAFQTLDFMNLFHILWVLSPRARRGARLWALPAPSGRGKSSAQSDLAPCPPAGGAGESLVE